MSYKIFDEVSKNTPVIYFIKKILGICIWSKVIDTFIAKRPVFLFELVLKSDKVIGLEFSG